METPILNSHKKVEYEPAHTCEHILNQTMVRMFGCPRSRNAPIERKKSKCDYILDSCPTDEQVKAIEDKVNEVISRNLDVTIRFVSREAWLNIEKAIGYFRSNRHRNLFGTKYYFFL